MSHQSTIQNSQSLAPHSPWKALILGIVGHAILATLIPSAGWVPDLALVGMVLAISLAPARWFVFSIILGGWVILWVVRHRTAFLLGYWLLGWALQFVAKVYDPTHHRIQQLEVAVATFLISIGMLWCDHGWSISSLGGVGIHMVATSVSLYVFRILFRFNVLSENAKHFLV